MENGSESFQTAVHGTAQTLVSKSSARAALFGEPKNSINILADNPSIFSG